MFCSPHKLSLGLCQVATDIQKSPIISNATSPVSTSVVPDQYATEDNYLPSTVNLTDIQVIKS